MWAFPEAEVKAAREGAEAVATVARARGLELAGAVQPLPACDHAFTHLRATYLPFAARVVRSSGGAGSVPPAHGGREVAWLAVGHPSRLALPAAQRRVLDSFARLGAEGVA
jgi:adenine-specific DNA glycosylase